MNRLDIWHNCYNDSWQGVITPESFAHPGKFAHGLIRRIYQHALDEGWLRPGDTVADPFAGVGLGALYAQMAGLNYVGVELEARFVEMGRANLALWQARYAGKLPRWGTAVLLQGDSRRLSEVIGQAVAIVSSPPYVTEQFGGGGNKHDKVIDAMKAGYGSTPGQLGSMPSGDVQAVIGSPPFAGNTGGRDFNTPGRQKLEEKYPGLAKRHDGGMKKGTGDNPQNLDHLPQGNVQAVISSPPYAESVNQSAGANDTAARIERMRQAGIDVDNRANVGGTNGVARQAQAYGSTPGQLGAMKAVISSPPYETGGHHNHQMDAYNTNGRGQPGYFDGYADESAGQVQGHGETFWSAARQIVEQCHQILVPGGYAIWVTKRFVKNGQIVDFTGQWIALCEACGFELVHHHRAMLVKDYGTSLTLDGEVIKKTVARKSFFRRLAERKGSPAIDWEDVTCMRKIENPLERAA